MVKCLKCGKAHAEEDLDKRTVRYGGDGWYGIDEIEDVCPSCGSSDVYPASECAECGEVYFLDNDADDVSIYSMGRKCICERCIKKVSLADAVSVGKRDTKHLVVVNGFLASAFTAAVSPGPARHSCRRRRSKRSRRGWISCWAREAAMC